MNRRVRHRAEELVNHHPRALVTNAGGVEGETVDIGDPSGAVDDPLGLDAVLGAALVLAAVSMSRIFGALSYYLVLWGWGLTAVMLVAVGWSLGIVLNRRANPDVRHTRLAIGTALLTSATVSFAALFTVEASRAEVNQAQLSHVLGELSASTVAALSRGSAIGGRRRGRYLVTWSDPFTLGVGPGLLLELERHGFDVGTTPVFAPKWALIVCCRRRLPRGASSW